MRKSRVITLGLVALAFGLAFAAPVFADGAREQKVQIKDCPDAALRTIRAQAGRGQILEIEKERRKCGRCVYEAEIKKIDGRRIEVTVAPCGRLLEVEAGD